MIAANMTGCAWLQKPRTWDGCAIGGALVGAGIGAASGIVIADNVRGHTETAKSAKVYSGVGGAAAGALIGGLLGHYVCDPDPAAAAACTAAASTAATAASSTAAG